MPRLKDVRNSLLIALNNSLLSDEEFLLLLLDENPGGGTLGISGWGCAARTLEPLAYTRASFSWILLPYTRVNSWFP